MLRGLRILLSATAACFILNPSYSQDATEIVNIADKKRLCNTSSSTIEMKVVRPGWSRELSMEVWMGGNDLLCY